MGKIGNASIRKFLPIFALAIIVLVGFLNHDAYAATFTAKQNGDWNTGSTWVGNIVPTFYDEKIIPAGINVTVTSQVINYGNITNSGTVTVANNILISNGIINHGTITNSGTVIVANNAGHSIGIMSDAIITNFGKIIIANLGYQSIGIYNLSGGGIINNTSTGQITISNLSFSYGISNSGVISNSGTITISTKGNLSYGILTSNTLVNTGTIMISNTSGSSTGIDNRSSFTNSRTITVANKSGYGIYNFFGTLTSSGTITVKNTNVSTGISNFATISNSGISNNFGTINNSGIIANYGGFNNNSPVAIINNNSGGTINNTAVGVMQNNGKINSDGKINNSGVVYNYDTIQNNSGGLLTNVEGAAFNNGPGGAIINAAGSTIKNSGLLYNNSGGTMTNAGTFNIVNATIDNNGGTIINNSGIIGGSGIIIHNLGIIDNCSGTIDFSAITLTGNPINNSCSLPVQLLMNDTTSTNGLSVYSGRPLHAEYVSPSSALVGKNIDTINMTLKKIGSPTGNATVGIFRDNKIAMNDTSITTGLIAFSGRQIQSEIVTPSSSLVGSKIDTIQVQLRKVGNPTGNATIGVFDSTLGLKKQFGTVDVSKLADSYHIEIFSLLPDDLYTISANDRIGIQFTGGDATNAVSIMTDRTNSYDGANSTHAYYTTNWITDATSDLTMTLSLTQPLLVKQFGIINVSTLPTSYREQTFQLVLPDTYKIQSGDYIGIKYTGGTNTTNIAVMIDQNSADPFDGTNTYYKYFTTIWNIYPTYDVTMKLINRP